MTETEVSKNMKRAGFFKRLAAIVYDGLVAVAVGMCAALIIIILLLVLYQNGVIQGPADMQFNAFMQQSLLYKSIVQCWVGIWVIAFFLWFWKHGGQTLGMRAWRLRLFAMDDKPVGYGRLIIRLLTSLGGLGTILVLLDFKNKLALQDRLSNIEVIQLSKTQNDHKSW
ncbi:RDD family protein [Alteromonas facilis]|uniref:RDD family protein n=1 Tax=Alteromonas facilis TaxID=2048004 RepID=UPI000C28F79C|nr:RDD family protein [Alteromonas facilis]